MCYQAPNAPHQRGREGHSSSDERLASRPPLHALVRRASEAHNLMRELSPIFEPQPSLLQPLQANHAALQDQNPLHLAIPAS
jgi:hypothetical protein